MIRRRHICNRALGLVAGSILATSSTHTFAQQTGKPAIPPGAPTRGFAVALISKGIDYRKPNIAARLARDGEGDVVGWDAVDKDRKPFAANDPATQLIEIAPALIAPIRIDPTSEQSWSDAIDFLQRSPARVAVVALPIADLPAAALARIAQSASILFIVPAGDDPAADIVRERPGNVLIVAAPSASQALRNNAAVDLILGPPAATREAPGSPNALPVTSMEAAILAAGLFTCIDVRAAKTPADVKRTFLAKAASGSKGAAPLLSVCR